MSNRHNRTTQRAVYAFSVLRELRRSGLYPVSSHTGAHPAAVQEAGDDGHDAPVPASAFERLPTQPYRRPRYSESGVAADVFDCRSRRVSVTCSVSRLTELMATARVQGFVTLPRGRIQKDQVDLRLLFRVVGSRQEVLVTARALPAMPADETRGDTLVYLYLPDDAIESLEALAAGVAAHLRRAAE